MITLVNAYVHRLLVVTLLLTPVPSWSADLVGEGRQLFQSGQLGAAENTLNSAIQANPEDPQPYYWLALVHEAKGELEQAVEKMGRSSRLARDNLAVHMEYARLLGRAGHYEAASNAYRYIMERAGNAEVRREAERMSAFLVGQQLAQGKDREWALMYYRNLRDRYATIVPVLRNLGPVFVQLEAWEDAASVYGELIQLEPDDGEHYRNLADVYELANDPQGRIDAFRSIIARDPGAVGAERAIVTMVERGLRDLAKGSMEPALRELEAAVEAAPQHVEANLALAKAYGQAGRFDAGETIYLQLAAMDPDNYDIVVRLGHFYARANRLPEAIKVFEKILAAEPDSALGREADANLDLLYSIRAQDIIDRLDGDTDLVALVEVVRDWLDKGRIDPLEKVLRAVLERDDSVAQAHYWLGSIHDRRREFLPAIKHIGRSFALQPGNVLLLSAYARVLARAGFLVEAEGVYAEILTLSDDAALQAETRQLLDFVRGQRLTQAGELERALDHYQAMVSRYPDEPDILGRIGTLYLRMGRLAEAEATLYRALRANPNDPSIHARLAQLHEVRGDETARQRALQMVLALSPRGGLGEYASGQLGMGEGRRALAERRWDQAEQAFRRVLDLHPDNLHANLGMARVHLGRSQAGPAEGYLRKVLELDPSHVDARLDLARLLVVTKRTGDAVVELERIVTVAAGTPQGEEARTNLANIYREHAKRLEQIERYDEAVQQYLRAIKHNRDDLQAHRALASIFQRAGEVEAAIIEYGEVLRIDPDDIQAYVAKGGLLESEKRYDEAKATYARAVAHNRDPRLEATLVNAIRIQPVRQRWDAGDYEFVVRELKAMMAAAPGNTNWPLFLGRAYIGLAEYEKAIEALRKVIELAPANIAVRYQLGLLYEQISDDELALAQYRAMLLSRQRSGLVENARARMIVLEERLKRFAYQFRYGLTGGSTQLEGGSTEDNFRSQATLGVTARFRPDKYTNLALGFMPSYSTFHSSQNDVLSPRYSLNLRYNQKEYYNVFDASYQEEHGLLLEDFRGRNARLSLTSGRRLRFSLLGQDTRTMLPKTVELNVGFRDFQSAQIAYLDSKNFHGGLALTMPFNNGLTLAGNYRFTFSDNVDPLGDDYARRAHTASLNIRYPFARGWSVVLAGNGEYAHYVHEDSYARYFLKRRERRETLQLGATLGLVYQIHSRLSIYSEYSLTEHRSNLPRGFIFDSTGRMRAIQSSTVADYTTESLTLGMQLRF